MFPKILTIVISILISQTAHAIYLSPTNSNGSGKALPENQSMPAMVSILDGYFNQVHAESSPLLHLPPAYFEHDCAGSVIAIDKSSKTFYVLTSAHCVSTAKQHSIEVDGLQDKIVIFGHNWMNATTRYFGALEQISAIYLYSNWVQNAITQQNEMDGDIAILQLSYAMKPLPKNTKPMQLANPNQDYGDQAKKLIVAGWGTTAPLQPAQTSGMEMMQTPNYAQVTAVPNQACAETSSDASTNLYGKSTPPFPFKTNNLYLCAGLPTESTACYGDSGGPLFFASKPVGQWDSNTTFTLYGGVDYSPILCNPEVPHTYTFPSQVLCTASAGDNNWYKFTNQVDQTYRFVGHPVALPKGLMTNLVCE